MPRYELTYNGFKMINDKLKLEKHYSFPEGYSKVVVMLYKRERERVMS